MRGLRTWYIGVAAKPKPTSTRRVRRPQVQYILCIRPNMENDPVLFEDEYVTQQLLSASIVEAAQVGIVHLDLFEHHGTVERR